MDQYTSGAGGTGTATQHAKDRVQDAAGTAQDKVQDAAGTAREKLGEVAGQAQEQVQQVAQQARGTVRSQVDQRSTQAGEQIASQASDLRSLSEELRNQGKEGPAKVAEQIAQRGETIGSYLQESDADRLLHDAERIARERPWIVALGGLAAGFAAARFLKASSEQRYGAGQGGASAGYQRYGAGTSYGDTYGGTGAYGGAGSYGGAPATGYGQYGTGAGEEIDVTRPYGGADPISGRDPLFTERPSPGGSTGA